MSIKSDYIEDMLLINPDLQWQFTCSYKRHYELSMNMTVEETTIKDAFKVTDASFAFDLSFYQTADFNVIQEQTLWHEYNLSFSLILRTFSTLF